MKREFVLPSAGTEMAGGFFAGCIRIDGDQFGLIVAPRVGGEHKDAIWIAKSKEVAGARSFCDGLVNTNAMMEAGSAIAKWARSLRIGGFDDWYLPAQDELEILYRAFKPTGDQNWLYNRSGINVSAEPPTYPYDFDLPGQTALEAFKAGGAEAFDAVAYWSSTQHAAYSNYAWCQLFRDGTQSYHDTYYKLRARAVRRISL